MSELVPPALVRAAAAAIGGDAIGIERIAGGYTGQVTVRLDLADGRSVLLKTGSPGRLGQVPEMTWAGLLRRESWMYRELPQYAAHRPQYLGEADSEGWHALLIEFLRDAHRTPPWPEADLDSVAATLARLHAPVMRPDFPPDVLGRLGPQQSFGLIRARGMARGYIPAAIATDAWWAWLQIALPEAEAAYAALDESTGVFNHNDVRSDNMLLPGGVPKLVDWGQAIIGSPARDSVYWSLGVAVETGLDPAEVHARYARVAPRPPTDGEVAGVLGFWAGYYVNILQQAAGWNANQALRIRYLLPTLRWLAASLALPPMPEPEGEIDVDSGS